MDISSYKVYYCHVTSVLIFKSMLKMNLAFLFSICFGANQIFDICFLKWNQTTQTTQIVKQNERRKKSSRFIQKSLKMLNTINFLILLGLDWKSQIKTNNFSNILFINVNHRRNHIKMNLKWPLTLFGIIYHFLTLCVIKMKPVCWFYPIQIQKSIKKLSKTSREII